MNFLWPEMLWLAGLLPLLIALYVWLLRRRKKLTLRFANLALVKQAVGKSIGWRRLLDAELCALNFSLGSSMTAEATFPAGGSAALGSPSKCGRLQCDRQCEFPGFADSCPWPAKPTHRKSASWGDHVLTLPAIMKRSQL